MPSYRCSKYGKPKILVSGVEIDADIKCSVIIYADDYSQILLV